MSVLQQQRGIPGGKTQAAGVMHASDDSKFTVGDQQWEVDDSRTSATDLLNFTGDYLPNSSFVAITAVPEPSTLVLATLGTALAA